MSDILERIRCADYSLDGAQIIRYDQSRKDIFPDGFLGLLYEQSKRSRILRSVFRDNPAPNFDDVLRFYLTRQFLLIAGAWDSGAFIPAGYVFPVVSCGFANTEKALFAGYGFFRGVYRSSLMDDLMVMGLAYLFREYDLKAIHGLAYKDNQLTIRFCARFGFKAWGEIPDYHLDGSKLVPAIGTTLTRGDFEEVAEHGWGSKFS